MSNSDSNFSYSKIKNIAIQLHNYSFFHGPSEISNTDKRFVGRNKLKARLKTILTSNETKSGAYLVTGYRGMGKSSFVSETISEISACHRPVTNVERFLRLLVILFLVSFAYNTFIINRFVDNSFSSGKGLISVIILLALSLFALLFRIFDKKFSYKAIVTGIYRSEISSSYYRIIYDFFIIILLFTSSLFLSIHVRVSEKVSHNFGFTVFEWSIFLLIMLLIIANFRLVITFFKDFFISIKKYFTYYRQVTVKINLGFEGLKEIDVLRLVASHLQNQYQDFIKVTRRNWHWKTMKFFIVILFVTALFHLPNFSQYHRNLSNESLIWYLFPSQVDVEKLNIRKDLISLKLDIDNYNLLIKLDSCKQTKQNHKNKVLNLSQNNNVILNIKKEILEKQIDNKIAYLDKNNKNILGFNIVQSLDEFSSGFFNSSQIGQSGEGKTSSDTLKKYQAFSRLIDSLQGSKSKTNYFLNMASQSNVIFDKYIETFPSLNHYLLLNENKWILKTARYIAPITRYIDYIVYNILEIVLHDVPFIRYWEHGVHLNYLYLFYFFFFYLILDYGLNLNFARGITHKDIFNKIKKLNEQIESKLTLERGTEFQATRSNSFFRFNGKKTKEYPIADVREIEKQLMDIFNDMDSVPRHTVRPEFIFIFDELDKIEPRNTNPLNEPDYNSDNKIEPTYTDNNTRHRQQNIIRILANLKHFITSTKAKFIFIAGRELYDAALADVSDRNFSIGSIFNDIIYVDSFLKDSSQSKSADSAGLTEEYICQFLFPDWYDIKGGKNIKEFNEYLIENALEGDDKNTEREKVLNELLNFIIYLTYRSNGTPKKITSLFEKYVYSYENIKHKKDNCLEVSDKRRKEGSLFLVFNFYDQYTFGMIAYMTNPFFYSINRYMKEYGDKLLVSLSFILDHIYKFHNVGFGWEDLESSPEVVDVNKASQVRELYSIILKFLSYIQIEVINTGLFNFKFNKKISDEINFLCKINERESAAFNFTLDESLMIKTHFKKLLSNLENKYHDYNSQGTPDFIRSLSYLHMVIGDLHFYDEEYDNSIIEYLDAVQLYGDDKFAKLSLELIIGLIKNTLKLGLAYEKRRSYDMAYTTYGKLTSRVMKFRNVIIEDISYASFKSHNNHPIHNSRLKMELKEFDSIDIKKDRIAFKISLYEKLRLLYLPLLAKFQILEKASSAGITKKDLEILQNEFEFLYCDIINQSPIVKVEFFDRIGDILFFKNGFLHEGKLRIDYKNQCENGIVRNEHIEEIIKEGLITPCSSCKQYIAAYKEFYDKYISDNSKENIDTEKVLAFLDNTKINVLNETILRTAANLFADLGNVFLSCSSKEEKINKEFIIKLLEVLTIPEENKESIYDESYDKIASTLFKNDRTGPKSKLDEAIVYFYLSASYYRKAMDYKEYGYQLTKLLSLLKEYYTIDDGKYLFDEKDLLKRSIVKRAIRAYYRAYENSHQIELQEYLNILEMESIENLNSLSIVWEIKEIIILYKTIKLNCVSMTFDNNHHYKKEYNTVYSMYNRSLELEYYEKENKTILLETFSNVSDINNGISLISQILNNEIYLKQNDFFRFDNKYTKDYEIKKQKIVNILDKCLNISDEIRGIKKVETYLIFGFYCNLCCTFTVKLQEEARKRLDKGLLSKENVREKSDFIYSDNLKIIDHIIVDSIFCLTQLIKIYRITGVSYDVSHSTIANTYYNLGFWCELYEIHKINSKLSEELLKINGQNADINLSPKYNYEMALRHYRFAVDTHRNGMAYKEIIDNMTYLNDDYNDNFYHFSAALDRYLANSGVFNKRIKEIQNKLPNLEVNKIYDADMYPV